MKLQARWVLAGEVYRARDTRLNRTVAIKVLPKHLAGRLDSRERFEREAKAIAALNHPHICVLYDTGVQDGTHFLVMECLEGETLADRLSRGAVPIEQALEYAIQIAGALDKAHGQGITHRDLKPGNIMLTKSGVKLLDFGLAKLASEQVAGDPRVLSAMPTAQGGLTVEGSILGTPQYMSPEQLEGREADARTDIFAFGTVVYEMGTGKRAFEGKSQASLIAAIMEQNSPSISSIQKMAPPALDRIVAACTAKDKEERFQSARDLVRELKWIADPGPADPRAAAAKERGTRRERILMLVAAASVLAAFVVGFVSLRRHPTSDGTVWLSIPAPVDRFSPASDRQSLKTARCSRLPPRTLQERTIYGSALWVRRWRG